MAQLIDGKAIAAKVRAEVAQGAARLKASRGIVPGLAVVRVGEDPASKIYVGGKRKAATQVGFNDWEHHYDASVSHREVLDKITELNADSRVHGVLLQLPLPPQLEANELIAALSPAKDADGFHPLNAGNLSLGRPGTRPCTPLGVMRLLEEVGCSPSGKRAAVVGRSNIVGKPMALLLLEANATVILCHRKSDLPLELKDADIVVAAAGVPRLIKGDWIKPGAVVVDVGQNRLPNGTVVGDVDFAPASERASWITPVPGGVGPMTIAMLLRNTLISAERQTPGVNSLANERLCP